MSGPFGASPWGYNPSTGFYDHTIDQSLRFNDGDSSYLTFTPSSATAGTWTVSFWVKRGDLSNTTQYIYYSGAVNARGGFYFLNDGRFGVSPFNSSGANMNRFSVPVYRDPAAWYHIVITANGITTSNLSTNLVIYVNGVAIETTQTSQSSPTGGDRINDAQAKRISGLSPSGGQHFDGYLAEWHWIDGTVYNQNNFGEFKNGIWTAKEVTGLSYGAAGYYLNFADSSDIGNNANTTDGTNDWTPSGIVASDVVPDSPTNNFGTMNPLDKNSMTVSEGNLQVVPSGDYKAIRGTFGIPTSGKWYFEARYLTPGGGNVQDNQVGIVTASNVLTGSSPYPQAFTYGVGYLGLGQINRGGSAAQSSLTAVTAGKVLGVAVNVDDDEVQFYLDGSAVGTAEQLVSTTEPNFAFYVGATNRGVVFNFGQDSTFAGAVSAGGNADANGIGDFAYAPPANHLALCTSNLSEPTIGPNSGTNEQADDYFNTVIWSGNSTNNRSITTGHATDFVWIKKRATTVQSHVLADTVRGTSDNGGTGNNGILATNLNTAESTNSSDSGIASFDSTGFTIGAGSNTANADAPYQGTNANGHTYVGWSWKAGGAAVSNSNGSITSSVSASTKAGFSIVTYTGNASTATVGHGLSSAPEFVVTRRRSANSSNWFIFHKDGQTSGAEVGYFNLTNAFAASTSIWNNTIPTNQVFSLGNSNANANAATYVAYCFHGVEGYSKFGSYIGNGNSDGTFVYTGFRPAWVLWKHENGTNGWFLMDSVRDTENVANTFLRPNSTAIEATAANSIADFLSNGFKLRGTGGDVNTNNAKYVYLAFAEAPFKYANAR